MELCYFCDHMKSPQRIIGRYDIQEPGPLFICLGSIHGNEPAGTEAIQNVLDLLRLEPKVNPGFVFRGRMIGLTGNVRALEFGKRFMKFDMNRTLTREKIRAIQNTSDTLVDEDAEIAELISTIRSEIADYHPERIVILDIHSTSATGGIFVISTDDPESIRIGTELHAPVILDFGNKVPGTTLEYFSEENFHEDIVAVVFECGQHNEPLSAKRAVAAIINCMRTIGCINAEDVENKHDLLLREYAEGLPRIARLVERCHVDEGSEFALVREFKNFEPISAGQVVAYSKDTPITAHHDGLILLPRLQDQGEDGFFVVKPLEY